MRKFSEPVNLRSRKEMTDFLRNHFRYPTLNSWNHATSYACNLKIHRLGLTSEIVSKLYEMLDTQDFCLCGRICSTTLMRYMTSDGKQHSMAEAAAIWSSTKGNRNPPGICPIALAVGSGISSASGTLVMYAVPAGDLPVWTSALHRSNPLLSQVGGWIWMMTTKNGRCPNSVTG